VDLLGVYITGRGVCMTGTSWRDKQRPNLVNFIAAFLAANLFRRNFLSVSHVSITSCPSSHKLQMVLRCLSVDWSCRTSSSAMGGYVLLLFSIQAGIVGMQLLFLAGPKLFPVVFTACCIVCCDDCIGGLRVGLFFCRVNKLKRQFENIYFVVSVPMVEQIELFNQSYFK
jgi:hypothetical protein